MINLYMVIPLVLLATSTSACSSQTTTAQNNDNLNYKQTTESNQITKSLNMTINDKSTAKSNIALEKDNSQYFTPSEIIELSQAFKHDSCDVTAFNHQTQKYHFSNTYGNPYVDGQDDIDELSNDGKCLLVQQANIYASSDILFTDSNGYEQLRPSKVDLKSEKISMLSFDINYSKFPSCNLYQKGNPFTITFLKNESGNIIRNIVKNEYEIFDCYENSMSNIRAVKNKPVKIDEKWQGLYEYSTYQMLESKGTGVGENYTIRISNDECQIDIVGYQVDKHFECFVIQNNNSDYIDIYQLDNNDRFGEIKYKQPNDYLINITYYDEYSDTDDNFYALEKVE